MVIATESSNNVKAVAKAAVEVVLAHCSTSMEQVVTSTAMKKKSNNQLQWWPWQEETSEVVA